MQTESGILVPSLHGGGGFLPSAAGQDWLHLRTLAEAAIPGSTDVASDQESIQDAFNALCALLTPFAKCASPDSFCSESSIEGVCFCQMIAGGDIRTALTDDQLHTCLSMLLRLRAAEVFDPATLTLLRRAASIAKRALNALNE